MSMRRRGGQSAKLSAGGRAAEGNGGGRERQRGLDGPIGEPKTKKPGSQHETSTRSSRRGRIAG